MSLKDYVRINLKIFHLNYAFYKQHNFELARDYSNSQIFKLFSIYEHFMYEK